MSTAVPGWALEALSDVYDPCCREKGISVVEMGLVKAVRTGDDGRVRVELMLTSGWCPFAVDLVTQVRERVEALPEVEDATVEVVWDRSWGTHRLSPEARAKLRFLPDPAAVDDRSAYLAAHLPPERERRAPG